MFMECQTQIPTISLPNLCVLALNAVPPVVYPVLDMAWGDFSLGGLTLLKSSEPLHPALLPSGAGVGV